MVPRGHSSARRPAQRAPNPPADPLSLRLSDDDRVGPPVAGRTRGARLLRVLFLALAASGGWTALRHDTFGPWLVSSVQPILRPATGHNDATTTAQDEQPPSGNLAPSPDATNPDSPSPITTAAIPSPGPNGPASPPPAGHASAMSPASASNPTPVAPAGTAYLPPSRPDSDPLLQRAAAAGLHAGLSRVVLARLSTTDFENAAAAIRKAVAETPDDGKLVWPRQRTPRQAVFKIHFVAGAAADCRRYVVTITKDGWSTTALPMERCGTSGPSPHRNPRGSL